MESLPGNEMMHSRCSMSTTCNRAVAGIWGCGNKSEPGLGFFCDNAHLVELSLVRISGCITNVKDCERRSTELVDSERP